MATYLVSTQTGADANGGTSIAVRSTGTDGVANAAGGLTKFTSISATWGAGDVGHGIRASSGTITRLISAVQTSQSIATAVTASGLTTFTSAGLFNATMLGCAVSGPGIAANCIISAYTNSSSMTLSIVAGAGFGSGAATIGPLLTTTGTTAFTSATGQTWNVGGMKATINQCLATLSGLPNVLAAGDSIYAGSGTYRETTAVVVSGTAGSVISLIGDVDGAKTGQSGQVTLSAYTTNDTTAPSATVLLALGAKTNLSFSFITFVGGTATDTVSSTSAVAAANYTFTDCTFNAPNATTAGLAFASSTTGLALGVTLDRCTIFATAGKGVQFTLVTTASGAADWDALCVVRNCFILANVAINVLASGSAAFNGGGVRVYDSTLIGNTGMQTGAALRISTTVPCDIWNSVIFAGTGVVAGTSGQLIENYNLIACLSARSLVSAGANSQTTAYAPLVELGQSQKWAGVVRPMFAPDGSTSPLLGFGSNGSGGNYPTVDFLNRNKPSGGKSANNSIGYLEFHDFAIQNTGTVPTGYTSSGELIGPGDQYLFIPVDAVPTIITLQMYMGSGYTGSSYGAATLHASGELGTAANTQTMSSTLSTWQTLTFPSVTPSKQGWLILQIDSYESSGTGTLFFSALT